MGNLHKIERKDGVTMNYILAEKCADQAVKTNVFVKVQKDTRAEKGSPEFKRIALCVFLAGLSCFAQLYLFQPILPVLTKQFSITPAESSFAVSFSTLGMALGLFAGVFFANRISRKKLISFSLISSSILTILSSFVTIFPLLIVINTVKGFLLAGATSVVMSYISEEVNPSVLGKATSLSIAGNAVGGMGGRIAATLLTGWFSWRWASSVIGVSCLLLGLLFAWKVPESRHFKIEKVNFRDRVKQMGRHLGIPLLMVMYLLAALMLGSFVSIYNYIGFRLKGAPFNLSHEVIASIYLMYLIGSVGSMSAGILSDRHGTKKVLVAMLAIAFGGLLLLLPGNILPVIAGLSIFTFCFFGAHAIASRIVAQYIPYERSTSISLYLLFYYIGSSVMGTGTGIIMHHMGWTAFVLSLCIAVALALALAIKTNITKHSL